MSGVWGAGVRDADVTNLAKCLSCGTGGTTLSVRVEEGGCMCIERVMRESRHLFNCYLKTQTHREREREREG